MTDTNTPQIAMARFAPAAFIDAGDVPWPELETLLRLRLAGLSPGDVLVLQSGEPEALGILPTWCDGEGCTLIHREPGDGFLVFWIGKTR